MDRLVTSGRLGGEFASALTQDVREVGSIPTAGDFENTFLQFSQFSSARLGWDLPNSKPGHTLTL